MNADSKFGDKYKVERELGKGGMGSVYLVTNLENGRLEALKTLSFTDERRVSRFKEEFSILSGIESAYIPKAFDLNENPLFITMEVIEGESLSSIIKNNHLPEYAQRLKWLREIAIAVSHIHSKKIIFCDLTPSNVMITKDNQVKLIDFGISIKLGESPYSKAQATVGTNYYMSPEQLKGSKLDYRSDIYSFGVVGYELLTGLKAFDADPKLGEGSLAAVTQVRMKHLVGKVPSARQSQPQVSRSLDDTLQICMQKERDERYDSIFDVLKKIELELNIKPKESVLQKILAKFRR